ncbi:hypothetical protein LLG95_07130 [bacterium]|nr:hypothetical protein [bacterium]
MRQLFWHIVDRWSRLTVFGMILVMLILLLLGTIAYRYYDKYETRARVRRIQEDMRSIRNAWDTYHN